MALVQAAFVHIYEDESKMSTTPTENSIPEFIYKPLPDAGSYIRLINILDFDETRRIPIHCELTARPISDLPDYHAISYTWGDANNPATILMNGSRMQVSQNCEYTLRQATWYGGDFRRRYYWVDAICINQSSDEEKGFQVALMGQIYKIAERVLACVGRSTAESRYLYRRLRMDSGYYRNSHHERDGKGDRVLSLRKPWSRTAIRTFYALRDFLLRPYFWRLWVYQELFLGREVTVCCGKQHISAHVLRGLVVILLSQLIGQDFVFTFFNAITHAVPMPSLALEVSVLNPAPTTLSAAIMIAKCLHCTDPRDRIYGVLSTVKWPNKNPIRPDYTKDRLEVAIDALKIVDEEARADGYLRVDSVWQIIESLELSGQTSPQLREAVQRRWLGSPTHLANRHQGTCQTPSNLCGWCLGYEDERWTLEGLALHEEPISIQKQSDYVESPSLKYGLLLPSVARPGDWCMFDYQLPVLIARPRLDGHFDIVGKALISHGQQHIDHIYLNGTMFVVYLSYEDIMVLLESSMKSRYSDLSDDGIPKYFETRVCGQAGSSYAIRRSH